jgi:hypothetical protein
MKKGHIETTEEIGSPKRNMLPQASSRKKGFFSKRNVSAPWSKTNLEGFDSLVKE